MVSAQTRCNQCDDPYERLGQHWSMSPTCSYPNLSTRQKRIAIGLLMGDGCIADRDQGNGRLVTAMITKEYLDFLDSVFGTLSYGVRKTKSAKEAAKMNRDSGFNPEAVADSYSDIFRWQTRGHPFFSKLRSWYESGRKVWPTNIDLGPTVLKHWYVSDGYYNNTQTNDRFVIKLNNERGNRDKVLGYFDLLPIENPNWREYDESVVLVFTKKGTEQANKYMIEGSGIPPGFDHKFKFGKVNHYE